MTEPTISFAEQLREFLRRNANWFLAAALSLLLLQDVFGTHGVLAMRRAQQEAKTVKKQIDQINEENRQLQDRAKSLKTDPQAIERIAREELGLARPGEIIFETAPKPSDAAAPAPQPVDPAKNP
ncbi:MAG TPA: septum formation initiator family protein [Candidatus Acidoferrales bacterium]|nr:septum formation initiator family protein [Candidatus Acidoferrales bacterium]